jgi:hypothetical protein
MLIFFCKEAEQEEAASKRRSAAKAKQQLLPYCIISIWFVHKQVLHSAPSNASSTCASLEQSTVRSRTVFCICCTEKMQGNKERNQVITLGMKKQVISAGSSYKK